MKQDISCRHCGKITKWYISMINEIGYQEFEGKIIEEDLDYNKDPFHTYYGFGWGMRFIEKMCHFMHMQYGVNVAVVRAANVYGPYDKFNPDRSNFIPALIKKAAEQPSIFEVWGSPNITRNVIFATDFAEAIDTILKSDFNYEIYNVGGHITTVGEVAQYALDAMDHTPLEIKYTEGQSTIPYRSIDSAKIHELGWLPKTNVRQGIERTTKWWLKNKETWKR